MGTVADLLSRIVDLRLHLHRRVQRFEQERNGGSPAPSMDHGASPRNAPSRREPPNYGSLISTHAGPVITDWTGHSCYESPSVFRK